MMFDRYPWHQSFWQQTTQLLAKNTFPPQVMLFSGPAGLGKCALAHQLIALCLCENRLQKEAYIYPCQTCRSCILLAAGTHPDVQYLLSGSDKSLIKIDEIRHLIEWCSMRAHYPNGRFILIALAETMHISAVNALLKTIETPPEKTCFILVSNRPTLIPTTLRSRCHTIRLRGNYQIQTLEWLHLKTMGKYALAEIETILSRENGSPLKALDDLSDAFDAHQRFVESLNHIANHRQTALEVATQYHATLESSVWLNILMQWMIEQLRTFSKKSSALHKPFFNHWDQWIELHKIVLHGIKLNNQLLMEKVLLDLQTHFSRN